KGKKPVKPGIILAGKAGIGKTSCAHALAQDFHWTTIELNASDSRNATIIKKIATSGALHETFDLSGNYLPITQGGRKLIILDEADNLYEKAAKTGDSDFSDRGGKKAILDTLRKTKQPIILIVNDYYKLIKGSGESFKHLCITAQFSEISTYLIVDVLKHICREEHIIVENKVLTALAERSKGDVRSAINDLQALCINKTQLDIQVLDVLGYRDREKIIFDALRDIFKTRDITNLRELSRSLDISPDLLLLWIAENLPREYQHPPDLIRGYEAVAKADVFFGRVLRRQHYGFWSYACDLMSSGVALAKTRYSSNTRYYPPSWFKYIQGQKADRGIQELIIKKISTHCHCSTKKAREHLLSYIQQVFQMNIQSAAFLIHQFDFSEQEIRYLLGPKQEHMLKDILKWSDKDEDGQQVIVTGSNDRDEDDSDSDQSELIKQQRLF
ncbi:MAG: replication factor C large subunit, partial [Candidatus Thermoplasmatota archaeon]|nr:replication factor C large subunit [Candidatus Thermoplasmatota archaeon]